MNRRSILGDMKASYVLSFLCGAAVMLGFNTLGRSNSPHHVYELRLYHVNEAKMDALKARFGNHTDSIFKRHNMKSIGYWSSEDAPSSQNPFIYIVSIAIQFISQVLPPSSEKACSKRQESGLMSEMTKRTRIARPLKVSWS